MKVVGNIATTIDNEKGERGQQQEKKWGKPERNKMKQKKTKIVKISIFHWSFTPLCRREGTNGLKKGCCEWRLMEDGERRR